MAKTRLIPGMLHVYFLTQAAKQINSVAAGESNFENLIKSNSLSVPQTLSRFD